MTIGPSAEWPAVLALNGRDRQVVDAGNAKSHQAVLVEFPVLVAIAPKPVAAVIVPLIGEAYGDAVVAKRPEFLDEPVVEFTLPLAREKSHDIVATVQEFDAVPPSAFFGIGRCDALGIARVPGIFGEAHLLRGRLLGERR